MRKADYIIFAIKVQEKIWYDRRMSKRSRVGYFFLAGFITGLVSILYNLLIFKIFGFYPDFLEVLGEGNLFDNPVFLIFLKDFLVGFLLAALFRAGCIYINTRMMLGITFFILYSVFAFVMFSIGDMVLMRSNEGMLVLLSLDGFIETLICTIPIRLVSRDCF